VAFRPTIAHGLAFSALRYYQQQKVMSMFIYGRRADRDLLLLTACTIE
jgi:hypothetical protein